MDTDAKLRPIYLINILKERTDEDHYLTTSQLCAILKSEYGMETHRTTIKSDIEMLQQAGVDIKAERSTQNQYKFVGRDFDTAEIKLLIDAVQAAKFISKSKSDQLVSDITDRLHRGVTILEGEGAYSHQNKQVLLCVVKRTQISDIRKIIKSIDENAFFIITDAKNVFGKGFGDITDNQ